MSEPLSDALRALRASAEGLPGTEVGVACAGTALQRDTVVVKRKAFVFFGDADVKLKLREGLAEAVALAAAEPDRYKVGAHGWVTVTFAPTDLVEVDRLRRWIEESFRVVAGKPR